MSCIWHRFFIFFGLIICCIYSLCLVTWMSSKNVCGIDATPKTGIYSGPVHIVLQMMYLLWFSSWSSCTMLRDLCDCKSYMVWSLCYSFPRLFHDNTKWQWSHIYYRTAECWFVTSFYHALPISFPFFFVKWYNLIILETKLKHEPKQLFLQIISSSVSSFTTKLTLLRNQGSSVWKWQK